MGPIWIKYNTQSDLRFTMVKRGVVDLAVSADWTPATADAAISKDGGNFADCTNTIAIIGGTPTSSVCVWKLTITASEASCAEGVIQIVDAATKAVEDNVIRFFTYGNASAKFAGDWSDLVRLGLTALPNAAAEAAGGLYTRGTGTGQIAQDANGNVRVNVDTIKTNAVVNAGTITFPTNATLASTTNITAGTITTVTTVTNQLTAAQIATGIWQDTTAGDFTVAASIGKSIMNGVALGTGLTVNDLTTKTGFALTAAYDAAKTAAQAGNAMTLTAGERTSVADAFLDRDMSVGTDSGGRTPRNALRFLRNKWTIAAGTLTVTKEDDTTSAWTAAVSTTAGANPVTGSDPV